MRKSNGLYTSMINAEINRRNANLKWKAHSEGQLKMYSYVQKEINKINKKYKQEQMPITTLFGTKEQEMDFYGKTARGQAVYASKRVELADLRLKKNILANTEKISKEDKELALKYKEECESKANQLFDAYKEVSKIREQNKKLVLSIPLIWFLGFLLIVPAILIPPFRAGVLFVCSSYSVAAIIQRIINRGYGGRFSEKLLEKYISKQNEKKHE